MTASLSPTFEGKSVYDGHSTQIPGHSFVEAEKSIRHADCIETRGYNWKIAKGEHRNADAAMYAEGFCNIGQIALASTRNHHRRSGLCECAMVDDIMTVRTILLIENMKEAGLM